MRGVLWTVVPSISPLPLVGEMDLSVVSADSSLAFVPLPLAGARFAFLGVTGSRPSVSPFFESSPVSALALALATVFFFGEARFLGEGVIGSVASPLVLDSMLVAAVAFLVGERFLVGWADSSLAEAVAPRFLGVLGAGSVVSISVPLSTLV